VYSLHRLDYDVAVGVSGAAAKETALAETDQPSESLPYTNSDEFAVWCKTAHSHVDCKVNLLHGEA